MNLAVTVNDADSDVAAGPGTTAEAVRPAPRVLVALTFAVVVLFAAAVVLGSLSPRTL